MFDLQNTEDQKNDEKEMLEAAADRRGNEMRPIRIQKAEKNKKRGNRGGIYLLAFLFPVLIFTLGFALKGVYPFGENSALVVDGVHQYTAFYRELSEQLGKGAGWTWSAHAMGYNFYGLFCYYLCSPFSFLVLLFMKFMYVNEAVTAVILIKAGLCSVSMAWYSGKKYPGKDCMAVSVGCMYVLSNFLRRRPAGALCSRSGDSLRAGCSGVRKVRVRI